MKNKSDRSIKGWIKIIESLRLPEFNTFLIKNLFHESKSVRHIAILAISGNKILKAAPFLYNLYLQSSSREEKKVILSALAELKDIEVSRKIFRLAPFNKDPGQKIEMLNILASFPQIKGVEDMIAEQATKEKDDPVKYSAIFNLATIRNYHLLVKMIDQNKNEQEKSLGFMALSANLEEIKKNLGFLQKKTKKTGKEFTLKEDLEKSFLFIRKILKNRVKNFKDFSKETQYAFLNAYIDSREKGLTALTRIVFNSASLEDQVYLLDMIDLKFAKIAEKESLLIQLCNFRFDAPLVREKVVLIFRLSKDRKLLSPKEERFILGFIQKIFDKNLSDFNLYFGEGQKDETMLQKLSGFLFHHGNVEIQNLINIYMDQLSQNDGLLKKIVMGFFQSSSRFSVDELKYFVMHLKLQNVSLRKRITSELNSVKFEKAFLRNKVLLLLQIISDFKIKKISDKIFKLYKLSLKIKDYELTMECLRALSSLEFKAVFQEIENHWTLYDFLDNRDLLVALGLSANLSALDMIIRLYNDDQISEELLGPAIDVLGEISPAEHTPSLVFLQNLLRNQKRNFYNLFHALGKIGNIHTIDFLLSEFIENQPDGADLSVVDCISSIAERNLESKGMITENLYRLLKHCRGISKFEVIAVLIILRDDYAEKILIENIKKSSKREFVYFFSRLFSLFESFEPNDRIKYLGYLIELIKCIRERPEFADSISQIISILSNQEKKMLSSVIIDQSKIEIKKEDSLETSVGELSEKKKFIEEREHQKELTIFFSDIAGYTKKSSELSLLDTIELVREYEGISLPLIENNGGSIIKKMGDGLMVSFANPQKAVITALEIQNELQNLNQFRIGLRKIIIRIGINTGLVYIKEGDIFGDTVNIASRMETSAKPGTILITESTYDKIKKNIFCLRFPAIKVKGKDEPLTCFRPLRKSEGFDDIPANSIAELESKLVFQDMAPGDRQSQDSVNISELQNFFASNKTLLDREGMRHLNQFFECIAELETDDKKRPAIEDYLRKSIYKCLGLFNPKKK